jgi:hypothetical protein
MGEAWRGMAFAAGTAGGIQSLAEIALMLFGLMIAAFIVYLLLGKI